MEFQSDMVERFTVISLEFLKGEWGSLFMRSGAMNLRFVLKYLFLIGTERNCEGNEEQAGKIQRDRHLQCCFTTLKLSLCRCRLGT